MDLNTVFKILSNNNLLNVKKNSPTKGIETTDFSKFLWVKIKEILDVTFFMLFLF